MTKQPVTLIPMHYRALLTAKSSSKRGKVQLPHGAKFTIEKKRLGTTGGLVYNSIRLELAAEGNRVYLPTNSIPERLQSSLSRGVMLPPGLADKGRSRSGARIGIDSVVMDMPLEDGSGSWVSCPIYQALPILIDSETGTFFRCDLRKLCSDQFGGSSNQKIKIVRLNVRYEGDPGEAVNSLTLYGTDVLTSPLLRDILLTGDVSNTVSPFAPTAELTSTSGVKRLLVPYSCRLKWDDGSKETAFINLDRHGNFSFYLKNERTLEIVGEIIAYVNSLHALRKTDDHPLLRSQVALEKVATDPV